MPDREFNEAMRALEQMAEEQRERFRRPEPPEPRTDAEQFAKDLAAAQSRWVDGPGLLR